MSALNWEVQTRVARIGKGRWAVSIGKTLARARRDAGLSIAEVSRQTGIKLGVVDGIERDDYSACGGDVRARASIRSIALAVGVDAGPLIEEFDAAGRPAGWIAASKPSEPVITAEPAESLPQGDERWPLAADDDTQPIAVGQSSEPIMTGEPPEPVANDHPLQLIGLAQTASSAEGPVRPAFADRPPLTWVALAGALVVAAILGGILLVLGTTGQTARPASVAGRHAGGGRRAVRPLGTGQPSSRHSADSPRPTRSASFAGRHVHALVPASIAAFGPGGTGQGDSPQLAKQALAGKAASPWHSAWYTTPRFGNLQSGTGLLLYMRRTVTLTSARIGLGRSLGADVSLRIGNSPNLARMRPVAHSDGAGGVVRLRTAPTRGRYVLIWFTRLPPDQAGTFQVSVYDITLRGFR